MIPTTSLLELFAKATKLQFEVEVSKEKDGGYLINTYRPFEEYTDRRLYITSQGDTDFNRTILSFDGLMDEFDFLIKQEEDKRIKEEKRKELIASLTPEQRELLGVK